MGVRKPDQVVSLGSEDNTVLIEFGTAKVLVSARYDAGSKKTYLAIHPADGQEMFAFEEELHAVNVRRR